MILNSMKVSIQQIQPIQLIKPDGAYIYNIKLKLLKCNSGYKLNDVNKNTCVTNCHSSCKTCSEFSENDDEPKCLSCDTSNY